MLTSQRQSRIFAATWFGLAAAAPLGAWGIYLFAVTPELWRQSLAYAVSPDNEHRILFVTMALAGTFSAAAVAIVAFAHRKAILRAVLVGGISQAVAYSAFGGRFLAFLSAMPLWWVYKLQRDV